MSYGKELEFYDGQPNKPITLKGFKGTFGIDSHGHSGDVFASWQYCPEAQEEEERVNADHVWGDTPERWIVPCNDPKSSQRPTFFEKGTRRTFVPLEEVEGCVFEPEGWLKFLELGDIEDEEPAPIQDSREDLAPAIAELISMNVRYVWDIYHRAWRERKQPVLGALVRAMELLDEQTRRAVRARVRHFDRTPVVELMLKALD